MDPLVDVVQKTAWSEKKSQTWSFYCPLCRAQRALPYRPTPGGTRHYFQVGLTAAFFTLVTWQWFAWKGIVSFLPLWAAFEIYYRGRVRMALGCPHCGFDPYLYLTDVKRARHEVESYWRKKFADRGIPYPEKPGATPKPAAAAPAVAAPADTPPAPPTSS